MDEWSKRPLQKSTEWIIMDIYIVGLQLSQALKCHQRVRWFKRGRTERKCRRRLDKERQQHQPDGKPDSK